MHPTPSSKRRRSPWADLPPDLLRDVSGRLEEDIDYIRFHAVCRPWRDTSPFPLFRVTSTSCHGLALHSTVDDTRRLWSPPGYRRNHTTLIQLTGKRNWVASSDGTAAWLFTATPGPTLLNLASRDVTLLPRLPDYEITRVWMNYSNGIIYRDGTVFLYNFINPARSSGYGRFTAAILCPGDTVWTIVKKRLRVVGNRCTCAMYHDGKVLVFADMRKYFWCVLLPGQEEDDSNIEGGKLEAWRMLQDVEDRYFRDSYVLESHGELLWVTIFVDKIRAPHRDPTPGVSLKVYMLEGSNKGANMRWVPRSGESLSDRVLFLGSPASFTIDVSHRGANGGCVYFVYDRHVLRYNLVDRTAKLVEKLRPGWGSDEAHVWLRP
ncbi:unnamed protein product [Alopecurus aequalis]